MDSLQPQQPQHHQLLQEVIQPAAELDHSGHRWCSIKTGTGKPIFQHPIQENVIQLSSGTPGTDLGAVSDTDSGLGVHETIETMPGPPTRGRKAARDTPIDNPAWKVTPAETAPVATTTSALPGAVARTDNDRPLASASTSAAPTTSATSVLPTLQDPSKYQELSLIGNGELKFYLTLASKTTLAYSAYIRPGHKS